MTDDDDARLIQDASRGDARAMGELLERHLPGLQRYVAGQAGGVVGAKESSADLVQSVCREVLERLGTERFEFQGSGAFKKWLYEAALLKIKNRGRYYRRQKRDAAREVATPEDGGLFRTLTTPSARAVDEEDRERLRRALAELPEKHREIFTLAHMDGLSHREISERLEITEAHSRVLLSRALAALARILG